MNVSTTDVRFEPDPRRVIVKPFVPGGEVSADGRSHAERIVARILALPEAVVVSTLRSVLRRYDWRHPDLHSTFEANFARVAHHAADSDELSVERRLLIGAYFTHEYAIEAAALANPSMVVAPDQEGLAAGEQRFVMSLRAIGEGHISSIEFRSGVIDAAGRVAIDEPGPFVTTGRRRAPIYDKRAFRNKLGELGTPSQTAAQVLDALPERFTLEELEDAIREVGQGRGVPPGEAQALRTIHWLASSNYESSFAPDSELSERALFPAAPTESRGMEDARFVCFTDDDGSVTYFGTYTAFDGYQILPQLIETRSLAWTTSRTT
jgi:hypothetical protein